MIVPDVNLLVYAYDSKSPFHHPAANWWTQLATSPQTIGLPHVTLFGFLRIMTHPRICSNPMPVSEALDRIKEWLRLPQVQPITPGLRHLEIAFSLLEILGVGGNLTTDVQLAAFAIENQAELHSVDADFNRFPGLRWRNPLL
jgi:toxin-antitoxin system PIN domain toxin